MPIFAARRPSRVRSSGSASSPRTSARGSSPLSINPHGGGAAGVLRGRFRRGRPHAGDPQVEREGRRYSRQDPHRAQPQRTGFARYAASGCATNATRSRPARRPVAGAARSCRPLSRRRDSGLHAHAPRAGGAVARITCWRISKCSRAISSASAKRAAVPTCCRSAPARWPAAAFLSIGRRWHAIWISTPSRAIRWMFLATAISPWILSTPPP